MEATARISRNWTWWGLNGRGLGVCLFMGRRRRRRRRGKRWKRWNSIQWCTGCLEGFFLNDCCCWWIFWVVFDLFLGLWRDSCGILGDAFDDSPSGDSYLKYPWKDRDENSGVGPAFLSGMKQQVKPSPLSEILPDSCNFFVILGHSGHNLRIFGDAKAGTDQFSFRNLHGGLEAHSSWIPGGFAEGSGVKRRPKSQPRWNGTRWWKLPNLGTPLVGLNYCFQPSV